MHQISIYVPNIGLSTSIYLGFDVPISPEIVRHLHTTSCSFSVVHVYAKSTFWTVPEIHDIAPVSSIHKV